MCMIVVCTYVMVCVLVCVCDCVFVCVCDGPQLSTVPLAML